MIITEKQKILKNSELIMKLCFNDQYKQKKLGKWSYKTLVIKLICKMTTRKKKKGLDFGRQTLVINTNHNNGGMILNTDGILKIKDKYYKRGKNGRKPLYCKRRWMNF